MTSCESYLASQITDNSTVCSMIKLWLIAKKTSSDSLVRCERNQLVIGGFPSRRASNLDRVSISSRYNEDIGQQWASYQIREIVGCTCTGNAGNVFPATARAVMHVGIVNPRWRGKRSRHSRRMRNPHFHVSGKRSMDETMLPGYPTADGPFSCVSYSIQYSHRCVVLDFVVVTLSDFSVSYHMSNMRTLALEAGISDRDM